MIITSPGTMALDADFLHIRWYGIFIALAFLAGLSVCYYVSKKYENEENHSVSEHIINLSSLLLIGAVVGARLYYVVFNWFYFKNNITEIPMIWNGGISIHGTILGGLLVLIIYTKKYKLSFLKYADILTYGVILGQSIGRWGNFFNSEAFGTPTNSFLKLFIAPEYRPLPYADYQYFHPTFLYESVWNLLIFLVLFFYFRKRTDLKPGVIFALYLIFYSIGRFMIEDIRVDTIYAGFGLTLGQAASMLMITCGITILWLIKRRKNNLRH
jgi:phosphatidylglycerol---prolipoprotein diacylglyceryl transferase